MKTNERKALGLLKTYTAGRFDIMSLAGDHRATTRALILKELNDGHPVPRKRCGVTDLRNRLYELARIDLANTMCDAARSSAFVEWAKAECSKTFDQQVIDDVLEGI